MTADPTALIALTMLQGVGDVLARALLQYFGTAEEVFTSHRRVLEKIPGIGEYTARRIDEGKNEALKRAEKEVSFIEKKNVRLYAITEHDYPKRLRECQDAPVVFYYKGKANLNATKIISIVGTRRATDYGRMPDRTVSQRTGRSISRSAYRQRIGVRYRYLFASQRFKEWLVHCRRTGTRVRPDLSCRTSKYGSRNA